MKPNSLHGLPAALALSLLLTLTACAGLGGKPQAVNLPGKPGCMAPVAVPGIAAGQDARKALARSRAALASANGNLRCSAKWYDRIRGQYSRR